MTPLDVTSFSASPARGVPRINVLLIVALSLLGLVGAISLFNPFDLTWERPSAFAVALAVSALVMMTAAISAIVVADRRDVAELGFLGNGLLSMAVLSVAHAAVTPDALFDRNEAFGVAGLLVVPAFALSSLPVLFAATRFGRWGARNWRDWSLVTTLGAFVVAFALAGLPNIWSAASPRSPLSIGSCTMAFAAIVVVASRHHRRHVSSNYHEFLGIWVALAGLAISALAPMADLYGLGFWGLHLVGFVSALLLSISCIAVARRVRLSQKTFAPVLAVDPFLSLDLAASAVVRDYLSTEIDEVEFANTADLALRVADRMGLSVVRRRNVGLAAVMHDVGKTLVPAEILRKPGSLSAHEFSVVQEHASNGALILSNDWLLAPCAHIVRAHHERVDGAGYPDRMAGQTIPVEARIIAACDAFQAITHDREYRQGLPVGLSLAILHAFAGQQWDAEIVRHLMFVVAESGLGGQTYDADTLDIDVEVPDDLADLLVQVDCEI